MASGIESATNLLTIESNRHEDQLTAPEKILNDCPQPERPDRHDVSWWDSALCNVQQLCVHQTGEECGVQLLLEVWKIASWRTLTKIIQKMQIEAATSMDLRTLLVSQGFPHFLREIVPVAAHTLQKELDLAAMAIGFGLARAKMQEKLT